MDVVFSTALATVMARAYATGVETSIQELAELLGISGQSRLRAALRVVEFIEEAQLELVPGHGQAEFETARVLRAARDSENPAARVQDLLRHGEGPSIEFKSSMLCSMRDWEKDSQMVEFPSLPGELLKTICAFLNSEGGDLLVGVDDKGSPCQGIALDMELKGWDLDKWQLHFQSLVRGRFYDGILVQPYLRTRLVEVESLPIFHVTVMPRATRSFVQREKGKPHEYFVRNGPRTDSLDLPAFYGHVMATSAH